MSCYTPLNFLVLPRLKNIVLYLSSIAYSLCTCTNKKFQSAISSRCCHATPNGSNCLSLCHTHTESPLVLFFFACPTSWLDKGQTAANAVSLWVLPFLSLVVFMLYSGFLFLILMMSLNRQVFVNMFYRSVSSKDIKDKMTSWKDYNEQTVLFLLPFLMK